MPLKLGDLLLKANVITQEQLDTALKDQREEGGKLGEAIVRLGFVTEDDITETLSQQYGVPSINLSARSRSTRPSSSWFRPRPPRNT